MPPILHSVYVYTHWSLALDCFPLKVAGGWFLGYLSSWETSVWNREGFSKLNKSWCFYPVKQEVFTYTLHMWRRAVWWWSEYSNTCTCVCYLQIQSGSAYGIYKEYKFIHHIVCSDVSQSLVGIAQFNTDPLENFCLAEWWMEQQSQLQDSARGHRHHQTANGSNAGGGTGLWLTISCHCKMMNFATWQPVDGLPRSKHK